MKWAFLGNVCQKATTLQTCLLQKGTIVKIKKGLVGTCKKIGLNTNCSTSIQWANVNLW